MKRLEAVIAVAVAFLMVSAGLVWQFGPYGLVGPGAAAMIALLVLCDFQVKGD